MATTPASEEMRPPHLGRTPLGGDTVAETPSRRQATAGPRPDSAVYPLAPEGDRRRASQPSALDDLLLLPQRFGDLAREIRRMADIIAMAQAPVAWDTVWPTVDVTGTSDGASGSFVNVFPARGGVGSEIRNALVAMNAAGVVQLVASRADKIYAARPGRIVAVARPTAQQLSVLVPSIIHLEPDENLYVWCSNAVNHFDFCGEFRGRRSE